VLLFGEAAIAVALIRFKARNKSPKNKKFMWYFLNQFYIYF
jgi:hypothetical protein